MILRESRSAAYSALEGHAMEKTVSFTSKVACSQRAALEQLLFFNGCQDRYAQKIVDAIAKYGPPEIVEEDECLRVRLAGLKDVQSLFALDPRTERPIGVAIYVRMDLEHVSVLHIGISEE